MNDLESLLKKSIEFRGRIIETLAALENMIDSCLVVYFSKEEHKQDELLNLVFKTNRITLESKKQILDYITKTHYQPFLNKYTTLNKDLVTIIEQRNVIAHYDLDKSSEAILKQDEQLSYLKYKNEMSHIKYTNMDMVALQRQILKCSYIMSEFIKELL